MPGVSVFVTTTLGTVSAPAALVQGGLSDALAVASGWVSDAGGRVNAQLRSTSAGSATVTGYLGADATGASIGTAAVSFVAGAPDASTSSFAVSPTSRVADGTSVATVELTVLDALSNPVSGASVFFATDFGALSEGPWTTDANGQARAELTSTLTGAASVSGYLGTDATGTEIGSGSVAFEPGLVDAVRSSVSASDSVVAAGGEATLTIEAVLRDAQGNVVPRTQVELHQGEGRSLIDDATRRTNARGEVRFVARSAVAQSVTYSVRVLDGLRPGFAVASTAKVIFTPVPRLEFSQQVSNETPALGDTVTVRYEVHNTGSGPSDEVVLRSGVLLPRLKITEVIEVSPEGSLDLATGVWTIPSVAAGRTVVLEFKAIARPGGGS